MIGNSHASSPHRSGFAAQLVKRSSTSRSIAWCALLVGIAVASCGLDASLPGPSRNYSIQKLTPRSRGAVRRLAETTSIGDGGNVWTWGPSGNAIDACTLWYNGERDALLDLVHDAEPGGCLWAMRALRHVDRIAFDELCVALKRDQREVRISSGCLISHSTVASALKSEVLEWDALEDVYAELYGDEENLEAYLEWTRASSSETTRFWPDDEKQDMYVQLAHASEVGDAESNVARPLFHLLEIDAYPFRPALVLCLSDNEAARYWGAMALANIRPAVYRALRAQLIRPDSEASLVCVSHATPTLHSLDEALRVHIDEPR